MTETELAVQALTKKSKKPNGFTSKLTDTRAVRRGREGGREGGEREGGEGKREGRREGWRERGREGEIWKEDIENKEYGGMMGRGEGSERKG